MSKAKRPATASAAFEPRQGDREDLIEALREITGFEEIRRRVGYTEAGDPKFAEGYESMAGGDLKFWNERGQEVHVPKHRLDEVLKAPKARPADAPAE
jgi:hypothetical protein